MNLYHSALLMACNGITCINCPLEHDSRCKDWHEEAVMPEDVCIQLKVGYFMDKARREDEEGLK